MRAGERIEFLGGAGDRLAARLDRPAGDARAWALFAHCFSCSKDIHAASGIARRLVKQGIGVLRFDFTGLGASDGDFANTNFSSNIADVVAAARWLRETHGGPDILIGHSLGGAAVLVAAAQTPEIRAVVTIGAPAEADHVRSQFVGKIAEIEKTGEAEVLLAGRPFRIKKQFLDDIDGHNVENAAATLGAPLLVAHAPADNLVGVDHASRIFAAARHPKSFLSLDGADHLLTNVADAHYVADVAGAWASRFLGEAPGEKPLHDGPNAVRVSETGAGRFQNRVVTRDLSFMADEPKSVGGDATGPSPYELLSAALGACTSMTLRMYAERKGWPLQRVSVDLTQEKMHADDCEACGEGRVGRVDVFQRDVYIEGPLDDAQRARLLEIADRCPVHRTLQEPVVVRTRLAQPHKNGDRP